MNKLRKIVVTKRFQIEKKAPDGRIFNGYTDDPETRIGVFHGFRTEGDVQETYSVALVEYPDGTVDGELLKYIKFVEPLK